MLRSIVPAPGRPARLEASALATILMLLLMLFGGIKPGVPPGVPGAADAPPAATSPTPKPPAGGTPTQPQPAEPASPAPSGPVPAPPAAGVQPDAPSGTRPASPGGSPAPAAAAPLSGYTIVLDPGHGGADPGARGASGATWEKYNAWFVALDAKALLEAAGARVVLTRGGDEYVTLAERVRLAQRHGAALFISIHNDWNPNAALRGVTTYYYHDRSRPLADVMQAELVRRLGARDVGVLRQPFYVLRMSSMPAVLLELGFLSNREDEARLADPAYRYRAAEAIYHGVLRYLSGA
ncbi:MAG TPA: N-acetylmuramoyl-L-alanine amidase [Limnochordales bacterium]